MLYLKLGGLFMVIEQSTIVGFYIASVAQIMMIALSLFFLHRKHPFRMTSIIVGIVVDQLFGTDFHFCRTVFPK